MTAQTIRSLSARTLHSVVIRQSHECCAIEAYAVLTLTIAGQ